MSEQLTDLFEGLYCDNQAKMYKLALGLTGNADDAEEITQEAFVRAFRSYHDFRGDSSFFTWIYRITINVAKDYLKQRARFPVHALTDLGFSLEEILDPDPSGNPETELLACQAKIKCLHSLTECLRRTRERFSASRLPWDCLTSRWPTYLTAPSLRSKRRFTGPKRGGWAIWKTGAD